MDGEYDLSSYWFLVPALIIWLPIMLSYVWIAIGTTFLIMELIGKYGMKAITWVQELAEKFLEQNSKLYDGYFKVAAILSYILMGFIFLCRIIGVEIK